MYLFVLSFAIIVSLAIIASVGLKFSNSQKLKQKLENKEKENEQMRSVLERISEANNWNIDGTHWVSNGSTPMELAQAAIEKEN